jgi:DNA-binding LytR/AlgR family response regulator
MHIAICDDNIADRKQLERLLGRESDKRKEVSGLFYAESFGDSAALLRRSVQYDLIFIDMTQSEPDGFMLALSLISHGISAPIVLCSSVTNYRAQMDTLTPCPVNLLHLEKPIKTAELSMLLDQAVVLQSLREPTIELRSETDTYYVKEDELLYAVQKGAYVHAYLKDGKVLPMRTYLDNFYDEIAMYTHFVKAGHGALFNITFMQEYSLFQITLKDGTTLKSGPFAVKYIKQALQKYEGEIQNDKQ